MKKKIMKLTLLFVSLLTISVSGNAQFFIPTTGDTTTYSAFDQQQEYLDSMLNIWYIKKNMKIAGLADVKGDSVILNLPDSVYAQRLKNIISPIPMTYNQDVQKWVDMYISKNRRTPYIIGMSQYYFPIIENIFDKYQIPQELKYLAIIESALNPKARSRAGAVGLWQFIYSTGKMYDLEISSYVDERSDPIKATYAAAQFLHDMYGIYGDWTLVLAAYNCGPGNVNKAIRRAKGKTNFWEIYQYLPRETRGYVPAFIAANYFMTYYKEHNIIPIKVDLSMTTDTVMVSEKLHLMQVAEVLNIPIEDLRYMNPQYKKDIIPAYKGHPYSLRLPITESLAFIENIDSIQNYKDSVYFDKRYVAFHSSKKTYSKYGKKSYRRSSSYETSSYKPVSKAGKSKIYYTVKKGDTYGFIASWHNVRVSDIKYWNNAYSNRIKAGKKLEIYVPKSRKNFYAKLNTLSFEEKQALKGKRKSTIASRNTSSVAQPSDSRYIWYQVRSGDNLWDIAQRFSGTSDNDIKRINRFSARDIKTLRAGQYIKIKRR